MMVSFELVTCCCLEISGQTERIHNTWTIRKKHTLNIAELQ